MAQSSLAKEALLLVDDVVRAMELVGAIAKRDNLRKEDVERLKAARERYFRCTDRLKALSEETALGVETSEPQYTGMRSVPMPLKDAGAYLVEAQLKELMEERDALKKEVSSKDVQLRNLLRLGQEMLSTLERWDQWEAPSDRPPPRPPTQMQEETRSMAGSEISMDID